jgi:hypothetical protein
VHWVRIYFKASVTAGVMAVRRGEREASASKVAK